MIECNICREIPALWCGYHKEALCTDCYHDKISEDILQCDTCSLKNDCTIYELWVVK